ncbi:MAG: hypothetical protein M1142_00065 [Patescibacteria group bacterium]|nr:hypothetical protein [Patescibacteria group bacterium]
MKTILPIIIFIILLPAIATFLIHKEMGIDIPGNQKIFYFYKDTSFNQSFISPKNNLNSVLLRLKNKGLINHESVTFNLYSNNQLARTITVNGSNIPDDDWVRFSFDKIQDSKNRSFKAELLSSNSTKENAIGVEMNNSQAALRTYHSIDSYPQFIKGIYPHFYLSLRSRIFILSG